jgi:hypothetical protein
MGVVGQATDATAGPPPPRRRRIAARWHPARRPATAGRIRRSRIASISLSLKPARHRQVQDIAAAILLQRAGEGPAAFLVDRDQERVGIARKPMLHPVGVMGVDVDIGDPAHTRAAQRQDREDRVVEIAEPGRAVGKAVMRAAAGVIDHARFRQKLPGQERGARGGGGAAEHLGEDGVRHRPEPVPRAGFVADVCSRSASSSAAT